MINQHDIQLMQGILEEDLWILKERENREGGGYNEKNHGLGRKPEPTNKSTINVISPTEQACIDTY